MPRWRQYWVLTKPRVTQLAVFCAIIGMFLATPGMVPWPILIGGSIGIWLLAGAAFAVNCLIEQAVDAKMRRTAWRPSATGEITPIQIIIFSCVLGAAGMVTLWLYTNPLTMWLTFATFVGYAVIYTWLLKPATPQNIVIGGLSGAMPPALGWVAVTNQLSAEAWLLVLIIFVWTPRGLCTSRATNAASNTRREIYALKYFTLHLNFVSRLYPSLYLWYERYFLSGIGNCLE